MITTQQTPTIEKTTPSKKVKRMWGLALDSWNSIMLGSLGVAALVAVVIAVSTRAVIVLQKAEELQTKDDFDRYKVEAGERIAASEARTKEAELKLEQLRKLAGPRDINLDVFKAELEGKPKAPVVIWYLPDSSDGYWFASRLNFALGFSGWQVEGLGPTPIPESDKNNLITRDMPRAVAAGGQSMGVTVVGDSPMGASPDLNADTPFNALFGALIKSTGFMVYGSSGSQFTPVPKGTLRIVVAAKADPMFRDDPPKATAPANPR